MALVTLSGAISAADLNNNFGDKQSAINAVNAAARKDHWVFVDTRDLTTSITLPLRSIDFTAPDDLQLVTMALSMWNPDATTRSCSLTLTAIDENQNTISKYFPGSAPSITVSGGSAAEFNGTRTDFTTTTGSVTYLIKGVTYRATLLRTDAAGGVIDRAYGTIVARAERRFM